MTMICNNDSQWSTVTERINISLITMLGNDNGPYMSLLLLVVVMTLRYPTPVRWM